MAPTRPPESPHHELPDGLFGLPASTGGRVVVAFSGGLDSSVLLHRLAAQPGIRERGLRALHVHHGLHARADEWAAHCAVTCAELGIALQVTRVSVARDSGLGLEAAARAARLGAFAAALDADDVIALAHHQDDQAETFLLRALRASGPEGLAAMRPWRSFAAGWMWRPLLGRSRAAIEAWAGEQGLAWIEDPANVDPAHDRNLLRREVLPLLRRRWPGTAASLARSAALCAEAADRLAPLDGAVLDDLLDDARSPLPVRALRELPPPTRARLLRTWIARMGLPPLPGAGVRAIDLLLEARPDSGAQYRWADAVVRAWRGRLHAMRVSGPLPRAWTCRWDGRDPLVLPSGDRLVLEGVAAFEAPLVVRARTGGERMQLPGRSHSHALKHLLQDAGMPPWQRVRMPLLEGPDGQVLAAGDALLADPLARWLRARDARLRWERLG